MTRPRDGRATNSGRADRAALPESILAHLRETLAESMPGEHESLDRVQLLGCLDALRFPPVRKQLEQVRRELIRMASDPASASLRLGPKEVSELLQIVAAADAGARVDGPGVSEKDTCMLLARIGSTTQAFSAPVVFDAAQLPPAWKRRLPVGALLLNGQTGQAWGRIGSLEIEAEDEDLASPPRRDPARDTSSPGSSRAKDREAVPGHDCAISDAKGDR
jgi:hypothetical protein